MIIEKTQTNGCDKASHVYGKMFNVLQDIMQDENKLKELSPLDYSALGMYIGKFVEQEINSSVVQIMRAYCGIDMPEYYCKRYPGFDVNADVVCGSRKIRLNEQKDFKNRYSLKAIPLGDAFYALKQLKVEDNENFFAKYRWLNDKIFLDAWHNLFVLRNKMAHIGEIIDAETLKENYAHFLRFLRFMPDILETKKRLAPDTYIEALPSSSEGKMEKTPNVTTTDNCKKNYATKEIAQRFCELLNSEERDDKWLEEINSILAHYSLDAIIFKGEDGKKGLKDCLGNILVPAKYEEFGFLPKPFDFKRKSVNAVRDGKYVLVALDGSGKELTEETYDEIRLISFIHMDSPYIYRKEGVTTWRFMTVEGKELSDFVIDDYSCGINGVWYQSGETCGYWQFNVIFLPPIYDNIEMPGDPEDPLLFTLNGVQGYVRKDDGSFIPLDEFKKLDEDEQCDAMWDYICEQYDDII